MTKHIVNDLLDENTKPRANFTTQTVRGACLRARKFKLAQAGDCALRSPSCSIEIGLVF